MFSNVVKGCSIEASCPLEVCLLSPVVLTYYPCLACEVSNHGTVTTLVICITCVSVFRVDTNNIDRILLQFNASKIEIEQNFHRILQDLAIQNEF